MSKLSCLKCAWYFYPYGLQTLPPAVLSWWAAKGSGRTEDRWESGQSPSYFQELESGVVHKTSEWHSSSQEGFVETRPKQMGSLEAQLVGLRQELVALSQSQAEVEKESHLGPEKMVALRNEVLHLKLGEVQAQLRDLEHRILRYVTEEQDKCAGKAAAILRLSLVKEGVTSGVTKEEVHQIVEQALKKYSADRIGLVDYALESSGASIVSRRSSQTYGMRTEWSGHFTLFGIPLWRYFQSPRLILQPDVYPGNCWAFRGHQGFVVVRLSARIQLTAITLEHVPKALSPTADIPSAPKDFVILGLNEDSQADGVALGQFTYDNAGEAIQTFHLEGNDTAHTSCRHKAALSPPPPCPRLISSAHCAFWDRDKTSVEPSCPPGPLRDGEDNRLAFASHKANNRIWGKF
uniref:SUN domain-containing protein 2-like n=1 Tax=Phascolarctos cinereus TaxID=38626 RepID=A0A6P5JRV3_PHACI|nr:SUN domain-containing protein 2-like [Phascolarctos cinereus]